MKICVYGLMIVIAIGLLMACKSERWSHETSCELLPSGESKIFISANGDYELRIPPDWQAYYSDWLPDSSCVTLNLALESEDLDSTNLQIITILRYHSPRKNLEDEAAYELHDFAEKHPDVQISNSGFYSGLTQKAAYLGYDEQIGTENMLVYHFMLYDESNEYYYILGMANTRNAHTGRELCKLLNLLKTFRFRDAE